jgi:hypothetical protein
VQYKYAEPGKSTDLSVTGLASAETGKPPLQFGTSTRRVQSGTHMVLIERVCHLDSLFKSFRTRVNKSSRFPEPFHEPPSNLEDASAILIRCNAICVWISVLGFILALTGILAFAWSWMSRSVSIFTSVCLFGSGVAGVYALH